MASITRSRRSRRDLREIVAYISGHNLSAAMRWLEEIEAFLNVIASQPYLGEQLKINGRPFRRVAQGNYVIYYRPLRNGIRLVRVIHGARDHERLV
jgi:toxin ParE1/3/4